VAAALLLVPVFLVGLMWVMQRSMIFIPMGGEPPPAAEVIEGAEDVRLHTEDGLELGAWFVPPQDTDRTADRETAVLVANGNAGNRESRAPLARALAAEGFSVLLFDYRGYGGNPGSPSEAGLAMDARAAADALAERGFDADRTVYFGESLGAAVAANLATERPPAALFLRSPFNSLADMGSYHYPFVPVRLLLRDEFPVADRVSGIDVPTTVDLHAVGDELRVELRPVPTAAEAERARVRGEEDTFEVHPGLAAERVPTGPGSPEREGAQVAGRVPRRDPGQATLRRATRDRHPAGWVDVDRHAGAVDVGDRCGAVVGGLSGAVAEAEHPVGLLHEVAVDVHPAVLGAGVDRELTLFEEDPPAEDDVAVGDGERPATADVEPRDAVDDPVAGRQRDLG
jgi:pimeloyl-ACP methyl ester carboxylesterase